MMNTSSPQASEYVAVWRRILGGWLHWPAPRIERFVARWEEELTAPEPAESQMFFHDTPIEYLSQLLQPPSLRARRIGPDDDPMEITHKIEHAVNVDYAYNSDQYDWDAARARVEAVLAEYGAVLPRPEQPAWYEEEDPKIRRMVAQAAEGFGTASRSEALDLPRTAKPAQLVWTLFRQGKLGVRGYTIEQVLALPWPLDPALPEQKAEAGECLAVVTQSPEPGPRKVLVFHFATGWFYWVYDLD
jgi:hypothetical protein